jgi:hypothetical protein
VHCSAVAGSAAVRRRPLSGETGLPDGCNAGRRQHQTALVFCQQPMPLVPCDAAVHADTKFCAQVGVREAVAITAPTRCAVCGAASMAVPTPWERTGVLLCTLGAVPMQVWHRKCLDYDMDFAADGEECGIVLVSNILALTRAAATRCFLELSRRGAPLKKLLGNWQRQALAVQRSVLNRASGPGASPPPSSPPSKRSMQRGLRVAFGLVASAVAMSACLFTCRACDISGRDCGGRPMIVNADGIAAGFAGSVELGPSVVADPPLEPRVASQSSTNPPPRVSATTRRLIRAATRRAVAVGRGRNVGQASVSAADDVFFALALYIDRCNDLDEGVLGDMRKASPVVEFAVASGAADAGPRLFRALFAPDAITA